MVPGTMARGNCFVSFLMILGLSNSVLVRENVVFRKVNEVAATRSRWLATFVIDMQPINSFFRRVSTDIQDTFSAVTTLQARYNNLQRPGYAQLFKQLKGEVHTLNDLYNKIVGGFAEINDLGPRHRRSLLPFIGRGLHFLFGTVTDSDLDGIKSNIKVLAGNQDRLAHIVEESLTIVNTSRIQIMANRQAINDIVTSFIKVQSELQNVTEGLGKSIVEVETFLQFYLQADLALEEIKQLVNRMTHHLERVHLQINMLALGRLTPGIISPPELRKLLIDVKARLPSPFKLAGDPSKQIWMFYQFLTCVTVLEENKILIVVPIPLLDIDADLEVYEVHNLPLPQPDLTTMTGQSEVMIATYDLESSTIAVDSARTKFVLLSPEESLACSKPSLGFCAFKSPIYPINVNRFCVIALFMSDKESIDRNCRTVIRPNSLLPVAEYLTDGVWIVSTMKPLRFSLVCQGEREIQTLTVQPPIGIVELEMLCSANSDFLKLPPYYQSESDFQVADSLTYILSNYSRSNHTLWEPFQREFPKFDRVEIPEKLKDIEQISMTHLIEELKSLKRVTYDKTSYFWRYLLIGLFIFGLLAGLVGFLYLKYGSNQVRFLNYWRAWLRNGRKVHQEDAPRDAPRNVAPTSTVGGATNTEGAGQVSSPLLDHAAEAVNVVRQLYPQLDINL